MPPMKVAAVRHAFRPTFCDRASNPHIIAEMALTHVIGDKVDGAHRAAIFLRNSEVCWRLRQRSVIGSGQKGAQSRVSG